MTIQDYLIISDSLATLTAISDIYFTHVLVQRLLTLLTTDSSVGRNVIFFWVPGHIGISGNERVDRTAKLPGHIRTSTLTPSPAVWTLITSFTNILPNIRITTRPT